VTRRSAKREGGFSAVAIIAAHNEADVIDRVIRALIDEGIDIHFLDDGSTDGTVEAVEPYLNRGVRCIERLSETFGDRESRGYEWERILVRKAQLAAELDADWFIHHDADEFRESLWPGLSLCDAIQRVDSLGFNAIDFELLNFWPVHDNFRAGGDVREAFTYYARGEPFDRLQVRCWKKTREPVDLASSGGHEARFPDRRVFPLRFILRHYPIRGQAHGEHKVRERRGRFLERERARGWHVQYDQMPADGSFIRDRSTLTLYDPDSIRQSLSLRDRNVDVLEEALRLARCEVERLGRELAARTADLSATHADAVRLSRDLDARNRELETRSRDLDARNRELDAARCEKETFSRDLDARNRELDAVRSEKESFSRDLDVRNRELDARRRELDARTHDLAGSREELRARTEEIANLRSRLDDLQRTLAARIAEVAALHESVADGQRRLDEFRQSLSWRWTAPARAAYGLVTGEGKKRP